MGHGSLIHWTGITALVTYHSPGWDSQQRLIRLVADSSSSSSNSSSSSIVKADGGNASSSQATSKVYLFGGQLCDGDHDLPNDVIVGEVTDKAIHWIRM